MKASGSVCYISGCNIPDGIGYALLVDLLQQGAKVCAVDLSVDNIEKNLVGKWKSNLTTFTADLTDWKLYRRSFEHCVKTFGRVDACFLNAGCYEPKSYWADEEEKSYVTMDVNAGLAMKGTRIACDYFLKQQSPGLVVVTGSVAAQVTSVKTPVYCASKWAVEGFVRSLGFLHEEAGIRVVVLEPGVIKTSFWKQIGIDPEAMQGQEWTLIPDIVKAWNNIIADEEGIPGGTAYEVTARGMRVYPLEGPRTFSTNVARAAGGAEIVKLMRSKL
ncbi:NAD(P)-binding protein [Cystobasidium minutum MCA 4210]|uniref:NAD(P)-binding protein n=1 Tax=Cystobasidium minutum MCA 4210 TaxID=1397322 RepID=UPI0034CF9F26|eukprot:jgi/Rhomi1/20685/CE20684_54